MDSLQELLAQVHATQRKLKEWASSGKPVTLTPERFNVLRSGFDALAAIAETNAAVMESITRGQAGVRGSQERH